MRYSIICIIFILLPKFQTIESLPVVEVSTNNLTETETAIPIPVPDVVEVSTNNFTETTPIPVPDVVEVSTNNLTDAETTTSIPVRDLQTTTETILSTSPRPDDKDYLYENIEESEVDTAAAVETTTSSNNEIPVFPEINDTKNYGEQRSFDEEDYAEKDIQVRNTDGRLTNVRSNDYNELENRRLGDPDSLELRSGGSQALGSGEVTPDVFPDLKKGKRYKEKCEFYGPEFYQKQKTKKDIEEKVKEISDRLCIFSLRLECVPYPRQPKITTPKSSGKQIKIDESISLSYKRQGICLCTQALSPRAVYVKGSKDSKVRSGCYIPAGWGHASICGHVVPLPYGTIDTGVVIRRDYGNSTKMCVPNAECRIGYNWVGRRCACKKGANWIKKNGTCEVAGQPGTIIRSNISSIIIVMLTTVCFIWDYMIS